MHIESAHAQLPFHCKDIVFGGNTQKSCRFSLEPQVFWLILFVFVLC